VAFTRKPCAIYAGRSAELVYHQAGIIRQNGVGIRKFKYLFRFFQRVFQKCVSVLNHLKVDSRLAHGNHLVKSAVKDLFDLADLMRVIGRDN
jgi:hypothetical protein